MSKINKEDWDKHALAGAQSLRLAEQTEQGEAASSIETVHEDTCSYCHTTGPFLRRTDGLWICWECREVQQRNIN